MAPFSEIEAALEQVLREVPTPAGLPRAALPDFDQKLAQHNPEAAAVAKVIFADIGDAMARVAEGNREHSRMVRAVTAMRDGDYHGAKNHFDNLSQDSIVRGWLRLDERRNHGSDTALTRAIAGLTQHPSTWAMDTEQARQLIERAWAVRGRSGGWDLGRPAQEGERLQIGGVTFELRVTEAGPVLIRPAYPTPEAGQRWRGGEHLYLITDSGSAVDLSSAELVPLAPDTHAPHGLERGVTFTLEQA